jgi:hypothetical protein
MLLSEPGFEDYRMPHPGNLYDGIGVRRFVFQSETRIFSNFEKVVRFFRVFESYIDGKRNCRQSANFPTRANKFYRRWWCRCFDPPFDRATFFFYLLHASGYNSNTMRIKKPADLSQKFRGTPQKFRGTPPPPKGKWVPFTVDLPENHAFTALPGHKLLVIDRGAVQFDFPHEWIVEPTGYSMKLVDKPYPENNLILEVSHLPMPEPEVNMAFMKNQLSQMFEDEDEVFDISPITVIQLPHWKGGWKQAGYIDHENHRQAIRRHLVGCANSVFVLFTFCFWLEDTPLRDVNWTNLINTLRIGEWIPDPKKHVKQ